MHVYRPARPLVWTFGFLAVLSVCLFVWVAAVLTLTEPRPGDEWSAKVIVLLMVAALASICLCQWISLISGKVVVQGLWITHVGPIRKRTIHLRDVTRVRWRKDDSATLIAGRVRQRFWFGACRVEDAADLIKLIRNNVPAALHEGWHPFYQARMKGRLDHRQRILLRNPRAKFTSDPLRAGRLLVASLGTSFPIALAIWGRIQWEFRNMESTPPSPITENWLLDCLLTAAIANAAPLLLVFLEHFRTRRQRRVWEATGIEFV